MFEMSAAALNLAKPLVRELTCTPYFLESPITNFWWSANSSVDLETFFRAILTREVSFAVSIIRDTKFESPMAPPPTAAANDMKCICMERR